MIWVIQMQNGLVFEAATKRKAINAMIEHYAENNSSAGQIKSIFYVLENGKCNELCKNAVEVVQDLVDGGVKEWRKTISEDRREIEMLISDYREAVL